MTAKQNAASTDDGISFSLRKEILTHTRAWRTPGDSWLGEVGQSLRTNTAILLV